MNTETLDGSVTEQPELAREWKKEESYDRQATESLGRR